ncbi:MAG: hypothetical protein KDN22_03645, partial [Verrucomicrobiae bacterium]|nr:hypothetical protein [Verrucomicrobiae bacterium]
MKKITFALNRIDGRPVEVSMMVYRCLHVLLKNGSRSGSFLAAIAAAALLGACGDAAREEPIADAFRSVPDSSETVDGEVDQELEITGVDASIDLQNTAEPSIEDGIQASATDPRPIPVGETPASAVEEIVDAPEEPVEALPDAQVAESVEVVENAEVEGDAAELYHDDLAPYGEWLETDVYGAVWQPAGVSSETSGWRPYTDGAWIDSDEGWAWQSNEPFGEICYHYGRWALLTDCGWVWVPGLDWAPAWVAWRAADGIAGWAPLPPEYDLSYVDSGAIWDDADRDYAPGPHCYNFVHLPDLTTGNCRSALLPASRCASLFASTRSFTGLHRNEHQRICNSRLRDRHPAAQKLNLGRHHSKPVSKRSTRSHADNPRRKRGSEATRKLTAVRVDRGWQREPQVASATPAPRRSAGVTTQPAPPSFRENPRGVRSAIAQQQDSISGTSRQRQQRASDVQDTGRQRVLTNQREEERRREDENARLKRAADIEEQQQLQAQREEQKRQRAEENARRQRAAKEQQQRQLQAQREEQ